MQRSCIIDDSGTAHTCICAVGRFRAMVGWDLISLLRSFLVSSFSEVKHDIEYRASPLTAHFLHVPLQMQ